MSGSLRFLLLTVAITLSSVAFAQDGPPLAVTVREDRLELRRGPIRIAEYVFRDPRILRPYFGNVLTPGGIPVTRSHPPAPDRDATDHAENHPGVWLGFGDLQGVDFWRNKGRIDHVRFLVEPTVRGSELTFTTLSSLKTPANQELCELTSQFTATVQPEFWTLVWDATFRSEQELVFGDQEEMGFGARVATPLTETKGGTLVNSRGQITAAKTWGQPAAWCDYSASAAGQLAGITLIGDPGNFRESWWHNRDYGVFVANPFGRAAMKQGAPSRHVVPRGTPFRIRFAAFFHEGFTFDPATEYAAFVKRTRPR